MPTHDFHPYYQPLHGSAFIVAFAFAFLSAVLGLALSFLSVKASYPRTLLFLALAATTLALACMVNAVTSERAHTDALIEANRPLGECEARLVRHEGYAQAQATARVGLWAAPLPVLVGAYGAMRSFRRRLAGVAWAALPTVLLAILVQLYGLSVGRYLWAGRCELLDARDDILGGDPHKLRQTCWELSLRLTDPQDRAGMLGTETFDVVLPDFKKVQDKCLAEFYAWAQIEDRGGRLHRGDILRSAYVDDRNRAEVTAMLDRIAPETPPVDRSNLPMGWQ
jgi:hypothetical protein